MQLFTLLSSLTPTRSATHVHTPFPPHTLTGKVENERFVRIALHPSRPPPSLRPYLPAALLAGKVENERFVRIALHQGSMKKAKVAITLETLDKIPQRDPTIMAVAFKRQRVYLLSRREPQVRGVGVGGSGVGCRNGFRARGCTC